MENLELHFVDGQLSGGGTDIIGDFVLEGTIAVEKTCRLKQYIGQHQIEYHGVCDGEGVYFGNWSFYGSVGGKWLIRVESLVGTGDSVGGRILDL